MCECCYQEYIDTVDEMLLDEKYEFATDTLLGIRNWAEENEFITDRQIDGIENIKKSGDNFVDVFI